MVLTAHSKPKAREKIPAVIHADGTGRIQIVRAEDDPLTYAYLKALGRHIGVELSVNTSFNVAGPIAQTPQQAIDTLRRSKGLDVVIMVADDGTVHAAWHGGSATAGGFPVGYRNGRARLKRPECCAPRIVMRTLSCRNLVVLFQRWNRMMTLP